MNKIRIRNSLLLLLTALIWGCAFVAQSTSAKYIGAFTMNGIRNIIGGMALLPVIKILGSQKEIAIDEKKKQDKMTYLGGVCCGIALATASMAQQMGIRYTTVGKAGFITALYIIIVPVLGIFLGKKINIKLVISIFLSVIGLYMLCMTESFSLTKGDTLVLACALLFSFHILIIDYFSPKADGIKMSCIQFFTAGVLCSIGMFIVEKPTIENIMAAAVPILYAGLMSSGVGYTLQIIGQKDLPPTLASLIMSMESVFSVLAGWVILGQSLSLKEISGCCLMFLAIILAQLPERMKKK